MKNSNSRDKNGRTQVPTPPINSQKLMKTEVRQPKKEDFQKTNYQRPASGKKLQSTKVLPPKSTTKKQYVIEDNMTESKIYQAKQGLQLIKKKMSAKGLSRQKTSTNSQIPESKPMSQKTFASTKNQEIQYQNRNSNMPPKRMQKKNTIEQNLQQKSSSSKITSNKNLNDAKTTPQNQRKQPPRFEQFRDQQMQIPIKPKKDFNALLQQQLRKEKQGQQPMKIAAPKAKNNQLNQYPQQDDLNLVSCRHCDRTFAETVIEKHQKICLKVFQSKRKAFDSAAHRAPQVEGIQQIKVQSKKNQKVQPSKTQKKQIPSKKQEQAIPKWKAASLAFRANLKQVKGVPLTTQQKKATDIALGMVQCNYCGRKFNQNAAARHIPFCQTKSKQLPKTNTKKK